MALGPPQCAVNMEQRLAALRRDQEIDGLRVYLIKYNLFPRNRDPENSPIRVEELKELVKHWKLHRSRGFWRDHPEKDDLVRALLQHIRSEAANKKRRQEAQEKYGRKSGATAGQGGAGGAGGGATRVGSGEMSDGAKHNFSMILNGGKDTGGESSGGGAAGSGEDGKPASVLARHVGGDLFYQRGDYDDGMIYLSRVDKSRFASDDEDPRTALLTTAAPTATPLDHLVHVGGRKDKPASSSSPLTLSHVALPPSNNASGVPSPHAGLHSPSVASLTKELKFKCVEGLYNMSLYVGFEAQMLREGALTTLATASLKSDDVALRVLTAATLLNLTASSRELHAKLVDDGALAALLELAHSPQASVKTAVARALLRLTRDESHHFRLVHEGVVVALTQLLAALPHDDGHKQRCGHALVNLAGIPRAVTCDVMVTTLVALAKSAAQVGATAMLEGVARALVNLSILPTTRGAMVEEGALSALSVLAAAKHLPLSERVAHVLGNCAAVRTNQELMVKYGAATLVADLLDFVATQRAALKKELEGSGGDPETLQAIESMRTTLRLIRRHGANVLAHLCCNAKLSGRLVAAGVVPRLLGLWARGRDELDAETEKFCVISVANLALDDRSRPALVQDGAAPLLLALLQESDGDLVEDEARTLLKLDGVTALSNLMLHPKNFTKMVDAGVVPALLMRLRRSGANASMRRACAYAMLTLAQDAVMKTKLVDATGQDPDAPGAVPTMLAFASSQLADAELCSVSLAFFHHLSTRHENLDVLFDEGTVGLLVRVLQKPMSTGVLQLWQPAMATLAQLATHKTKRATFLEDGVLEAMQHALTAAQGDALKRLDATGDALLVQTQFAAAQILCRLQELCCGSATKKDMEVPAFFTSLLLLTTQSSAKNSRRQRRQVATQHRTVLRCALAISRCTTSSPRGLKTLSRHPDFPPALNGVMRTGLHEAQVCAAVALCNLASAGTSLPRVWRDATPDDFIVIALLRLNRDETKEICATALFNLLTHEASRETLVKDGALYALLQLASRLENSDEVRDLALRALYNLSLGGSQQQLLLDMEIVRALGAMYSPSTFSTEMKRLLCGILSNLSAVRGHERQLLLEGAMAVLRPLAKVRDPETKAYAANILYNLSCCEEVVVLLVRGGAQGGAPGGAASSEDMSGSIVTLLIALLKSENRDVRRYAALTLANLSGHPLALAALSGDGEPTVVVVLCDVLKRTMASCVETSVACVFALRNLLTRSENQQRFVLVDGVGTLAAILASDAMQSEARTLLVATELVCGLATTVDGPGADERLAKDGIVRALLSVAKGSTSGATAMPILTSLSKLSTNVKCHEVLLRDGALDAAVLLAKITDSNSSHVQAFKGLVGVKGEEFCHHCVILLRNLVHQGSGDAEDLESSVKGQWLVGQPALVPMLLALAQSSSAETRENVVVALHNVARLRRCRLQLLKHDGVKGILRLATSATSAVTRHLCGLTLQLLSKQGDGDDPHLATIKQEGIVAAIAMIADTHHAHDLPLLAVKAIRAVEFPRPVAKPSTQLITTGHAPVAQRGAPPDWAKVTITTMAPWPDLERLTAAVDLGNDDEVDGDDEYDGESDEESEEHKSKVPSSPGNSRLRVTPSPSSSSSTLSSFTASVTIPRTCSTDTVLGTFQLLEDESLDKVRVNVDVELAAAAQRRTSSRGNAGVSGGLNELPVLHARPATAPEDEATLASTSTPPAKRSTLSLARADATSPVKSVSGVSTPKRKSRTLEPLPSPSRLGASTSTPVL